MELLDRLKGLLLGGAVGDALGAPVEFLKRSEIIDRFGPSGIATFAPAYGRLGAITDDTQMTLFTLEGLIRAQVRGQLRGFCNIASVIDHAYKRWHLTQSETPSLRGDADGWLIQQTDLWSRRAPGVTCMSALASKASFGAPARNDSKGAGGIMRVGPIGLLRRDPYELGCEVAALTHGHVTGIVASGWFSAWVRELAEGHSIGRSAERAWDACRGRAPELDRALKLAFDLAGRGRSDVVPATLGEGWIAEEAAAIALWCVLVCDRPMEVIGLAVNIDGDSDTTGTLVGQILGAQSGAGWIPSEFLDQLELAKVMIRLAEDASTLFSSGLDWDGPEGEQFLTRYPGW